ncbi:hypothetical protein DL240_13455 [Lujinxingia litoralis]|uniref:Uncharacterized protein n=1 Tax=Lujinxingia litoralis TaxID=2211119 RepID=A0A328C7M6_9DELT|nr:DUF892 family protein [Lujinxingia litoralis]RAL21135.1 hypothetical protein DL240_13455 [Lujinxingia litoralis]
MTGDHHRELLIRWLQGAYALEVALMKALGRQAEHATEFPELHARLNTHKIETERHAGLVEHCLKDLGAEPPNVQAKASGFLGAAQAGFTGFMDNPFIADTLVGSSSEELEIAVYQAISTLAEKLGEEEIVSICSDILEDERSMLAYFNDNLPLIIKSGIENDLLQT